ncbi:MAG: hypothetical protein OXH46_00780 [Gemmatimonadetes bacterium]|nr:hypothetical protein [Gemmatimonadota bacterium]
MPPELDAPAPGLAEALGDPLERVFSVALRCVQRQQVAILRIGDEQQPVEDAKSRLVGLLKIVRSRTLRIHRRHNGAGKRRHHFAVDALPKTTAEIRGVVLARLEDVADAPALRQRGRGQQEPEVTGVISQEEVEINLDERLGPSASTGADARLGRIEAECAARHCDHPVQALPVGLRQRIGHRRDAVEPRARGVDLLGPVQENGHRRLPVSGQQQHRRSGKLLGGEPETLDQRASPERSHAARLLGRKRPVPARRNTLLKFLHREETAVAETRDRCLQSRNQPMKEPDCGVPPIRL